MDVVQKRLGFLRIRSQVLRNRFKRVSSLENTRESKCGLQRIVRSLLTDSELVSASREERQTARHKLMSNVPEKDDALA